jgi:hypothetical protein
VSVLIGRFCQLMGMVILPIGLYIGLVRGDVRTEVKLLAIGGCLYLVGYLLAKK